MFFFSAVLQGISLQSFFPLFLNANEYRMQSVRYLAMNKKETRKILSDFSGLSSSLYGFKA